jgi:hypothetical protein
MTPAFTPAALRTARTLARAFGHGWATDPAGPTDAEILDLGIGGAVEAWESRLAELDSADPDGGHEYLKWRGIAPATEHRSGSGTVVWAIAPSGAVEVAVAVAAHYPRPEDAGRVLWTLRVSNGTVTGGMTPGAVWPTSSQGWEEGCAQIACKALGISAVWSAPIPLPPARPLVTQGPVRRF